LKTSGCSGSRASGVVIASIALVLQPTAIDADKGVWYGRQRVWKRIGQRLRVLVCRFAARSGQSFAAVPGKSLASSKKLVASGLGLANDGKVFCGLIDG
jgi:hypothetical protein